jgi:DinB superfamily
MKFQRAHLIEELLVQTEQNSKNVEKFKTLSREALNFKENPERWSILECIEHLNRYGEFYLPELEARILATKPRPEADTFSSGMIGNYFANLMKVRDGKMTKMKSPKDKNPSNSEISVTALEKFTKQQQRLEALLHQAKQMDLQRIKCSISLTSLIKLRLGDTFRFFINHIERHVYQANKVYKKLGKH